MDKKTYITEETKQRLRSIPLTEVLRMNGYTPVRRTKSSVFYRCPMPGHNDSDASFSVERETNGTLQRFHCLGCGVSGQGAIDLQAELMGASTDANGFIKVCEKLSTDFCIPINGHDSNTWYRRIEKTKPQEFFSYTETKWTDDMLRSIGCEVSTVYVENTEEDSEEATDIKIYSFGEGYYDRNKIHKKSNFNAEEITRAFGCKPVSSFTLPAKTGKDGKLFSTRIESTDSYPVFIIESMDSKEQGRVKKYEPYCIPDKFGASYKNTWYYRDGKKKRTKLAGTLYGDRDIMDCLMSSDALPQDSSEGGRHPIETVIGSNGQKKTKFKRIIICSGFRDAVNVYFHSDAHVVYPLSESAGIDAGLIKRLLNLSNQVYILYDSDKTGQKNARAINMAFPQLRNVELPKNLSALTERRNGKPCKDIAGYFETYATILKREGNRQNINDHFQVLLSQSVPIMFWQKRCISTRKEQETGVMRYRYQIITDCMTRFLSYSGLQIYDDTSTGDSNFVYIRDNIVEFVPEKSVLVRARQIMKDYLCSHPYWNDPDLSTVISTSKGINSQTIREVSHICLNFNSFGEDFDYLFFQNGALKVTADDVKLIDYRDFPYHVNSEAILPIDYIQTERCFEIVKNEEVDDIEGKHKTMIEKILKTDTNAIRAENMRYTTELRLWQFKLILSKPIEQMPVPFQFIYDTCRVFWREEEKLKANGKKLGNDEKQFQDAHFINKAGGLGYMLSRFRTGARQQMGQLVDYRVNDEKKNTGRNGKSLIAAMLSCVRVGCKVDGKSFKTSPDSLAKNFREYKPSVHGFIYIDDLLRNFNAELLFGLSSSITVKNLYHDEVSVAPEQSAKILFSSNRCFDMTDPSTFGRLYPMMVSDYYHAATMDGMRERSPYQKFGHTLVDLNHEQEYMETVNMLIQFLQFYLSNHQVIIPPLEQGGMHRYIHRAIRDQRFVGWASCFFQGDVFGIPIAKQDLLVSLFQYKGMTVTKQIIDAYSKSPEFSEMMRTYCALMGIIINPEVVFVRRSDTERGLPRAQVFAYDFDTEGHLNGKRSRRHNVNVYYFFKEGKAPRTVEEVTTAHCSTDPFPDGYIPEE